MVRECMVEMDEVIKAGLSDLKGRYGTSESYQSLGEEDVTYSLSDQKGEFLFTWVPPSAEPIHSRSRFGLDENEDEDMNDTKFLFGLRVVPLEGRSLVPMTITPSTPLSDIGQVRVLKVNGTCGYAMLQSEQSLYCCRLPPRRTDSISTKEPFIRSTMEPIQIGRRLHTHLPNVKILSAEWHSLSRHGGHLVVLTSDGYLRMYDLSNVVKDPGTGLVYIDKCELEVAVCDMSGTSGTPVCMDMPDTGTTPAKRGWASMAVRVLLTDSSIVTLCPILPVDCCLSKADLEQMHEAMAQMAEYTDDDTAKLELRLTREWLSKLSAQADRSISEIPTDEEETNEQKNKLLCLSVPMRRGQLQRMVSRLSAKVLNASTNEGGDFGSPCSLIVSGRSPVMYAIGYTSGMIRVCLSVTPLCGRWGTSLNEEDMYALENVNITNREASRVAFFKDTLHDNRFFAMNSYGVFRIAFPDIGSAEGLAATLVKGFSSLIVNHIIVTKLDDNEYSRKVQADSLGLPFVALSVVSGLHLGYHLLVVTRSGEVVKTRLNHLLPTGNEDGKGNDSRSSAKKVSRFGDEIEKILRDNELPVYRCECDTDEQKLRFLATYCQRIRETHIVAMYEVGNRIHAQKEQARLVIAHQENQMTTAEHDISILDSSISKMREKVIEIGSRIKHVVSSMNDELELQRTDSEIPALTDAEKKYWREVKTMNHKLKALLLPSVQSMNQRSSDITKRIEKTRLASRYEDDSIPVEDLIYEIDNLGKRISRVFQQTTKLNTMYLSKIES
eukprot:CFRG5472T1